MIVARDVAAHSDMLCELREFLWGLVNLVKLAELVKLLKLVQRVNLVKMMELVELDKPFS